MENNQTQTYQISLKADNRPNLSFVNSIESLSKMVNERAIIEAMDDDGYATIITDDTALIEELKAADFVEPVGGIAGDNTPGVHLVNNVKHMEDDFSSPGLTS